MKKGFTLVELIATIVILSIIAVIVTPNILVSIKDYKKQINDSNLESIIGAAKNWSADHIDDANFPTSEDSSLILTIDELEKEGYIKENLKDVLNGGTFNDQNHFTFVVVNCTVIKDEFGIKEDNYSYSYEVYTSIDNYITTKAIEYVKDNNITTTTSIDYSDLTGNSELTEKIYINSTLKYSESYSEEIEETNLTIDPISNITITVEEYGKTEEKTYEYQAAINWSK